MTSAEIIMALGNTGQVAKALGVSLAAVSNWKARGIPHSRGLDVAQMAWQLGRTQITPDAIRAASAGRAG
jgi:hypothetical protein